MSREVVRALNDRAGCELVLTGLIEQGQSGAAYVRWPDGRESVVTTAFASIGRKTGSSPARSRRTARAPAGCWTRSVVRLPIRAQTRPATISYTWT
ncbi:hypothetical protein [Flindersiella endophytica]